LAFLAAPKLGKNFLESKCLFLFKKRAKSL
jgi:hypothetical protein